MLPGNSASPHQRHRLEGVGVDTRIEVFRDQDGALQVVADSVPSGTWPSQGDSGVHILVDQRTSIRISA